MKSELMEQRYHPRYFKDMIVMLMQMKYNKLGGIEYEYYIPLMKSKLENYDATFERQYLEILSDEPDFLQRYNTLAQPLFDVIDKKEKKSKQVLNYYLDDIKTWDDNFVPRCEKDKLDYSRDGKFLYYVNPGKVIEKLKHSNVKEIYSFFDGIKAVYCFSNLNDFFKADASNIQELINKMDDGSIKELNNVKITRKIALIKLKNFLNKSLQLIEIKNQ